MNWMDKLERKLGRYAVPNLSRYFVGAIVLRRDLRTGFPTM